MSTIEIDGKKYEVKGTETKANSFGIHTNAGTYWMKPCKPKEGQAAFWMGKDGFAVDLPPECPQRISRITFCNTPDLTDTYLDEVKAGYARYLDYWRTITPEAHAQEFEDYYPPVRYENEGELVYDERVNQWRLQFENSRERLLAVSFDDFRKDTGKRNAWILHGNPELAAQHGYMGDNDFIYHMNLEGRRIDPACLHKFKWAAEYMDEDGHGTFIFFERLAGPDSLPDSLQAKEVDERTRVVFAKQFKGVSLLSVPPLNVTLRARHTDKALSFLHENIERDWILWSDVIIAADNPTTWKDGRNPLEHLHNRKKSNKKDLFEKIIEERGEPGAFEVRLNPNYRFEIE